MTKFHPLIASLWAASGAGTAVLAWYQEIQAGIQIAYVAITALGGAFILLYQKKLAADREDREAMRARDLATDIDLKTQASQVALAANKAAMDEIHSRLDAVIVQRDRESKRADQMFEELRHITELTQKTRCVFPVDGHSRCDGKESPP